MKKRSGFTVMARLIGLVKPLSGYMVLAILMGLVGRLCAAFITIFGGFAVLDLLGFATPVALKTTFVCVLLFALVRGIFRYAEQSCNHFIAFKLLALIRDKVFRALRRLCPAKLEGRDRGDLISVITSDIELLEVFYAHTISPAAIAALFTLIMCLFIGHYHALLGLLALAAYVCVGVVIPLITSRRSCNTGMRFRTESGALSAFVLDSLRGLNETIQYDRGAERRAEMDARTDALSKEEAKLKRLTGQNMGITNTAILLFDLAMLVSSAALVQRGAKVDQLSANDLSPLMLAVKMNNKANVEALLAAGASVNLSNKAGYTAIGYSRAGEVRQLLLAQHAELKGQAARMAQSELQFCANAFADKLAYSDIARAVNNDTRPDIMRHQQSCPELGELTMLLGEFTFTPAGATYLGEPVTCKVSEYRKTFEVNCR